MTRRGFISMLGAGAIALPALKLGKTELLTHYVDPRTLRVRARALVASTPLEDFHRMVLRQVAAAVGLPAELLERTAEVPYSASRLVLEANVGRPRGGDRTYAEFVRGVADCALRAGAPVNFAFEGGEPGASTPGSGSDLSASTVALGVGHCPGPESKNSLGVERDAG